jgi:polysaccharide export outer membrane protein
MQHRLKFVEQTFFGLIFMLFILSSCVPIKKQVYLQIQEDSAKSQYINQKLMDYRLRPGNNLHIRIISFEEEVTDYFNMGMSESGNIYYDAAIYLTSYSVNDSGYIEMPFLGKVQVMGLTVNEIKEKIQERIGEYLNKTMVVVKLVNYNVTIVGEVNRPGQYKIYQDNLNIFEVLGMAGDLTTYAKRDDVLLIRKDLKGSKTYRINLLADNLLESPYYFMLPDDIVYVKPVKGRNFAFEAFPYALLISSISLVIALIAIIK